MGDLLKYFSPPPSPPPTPGGGAMQGQWMQQPGMQQQTGPQASTAGIPNLGGIQDYMNQGPTNPMGQGANANPGVNAWNNMFGNLPPAPTAQQTTQMMNSIPPALLMQIMQKAGY